MKKLKKTPVEIYHDYQGLSFPKMKINAVAQQIYHHERINSLKRVSIILCSNYKIKKLNADYRDKNRITDVLAFPFNDKDFLGEIYISLQRCQSQAPKYGLSYNQEIIRVFVHGMFHLLGFTHSTEPTRKTMEAKERKYCCL